MRAYGLQAGVAAALDAFGVKHANFLSPLATSAFWKDVAHSARLQAVGQPLKAFRQIRDGTLFNPETGLYHHGLPHSAKHLIGSLAFPVGMSALFASLSPPGSRGALVGDMVGRTAGSMLGHPLGGVVGSTAAGMALAEAGRSIGQQFDSPPTQEVVSY